MAAPDPAPPVQAPEPPVEPPKPKILVSKRVARVFDALFPSHDGAGQTPKEIAWEELLYAMNDIGLRPHKLYGSVWIFRPVEGEECKVAVERAIQWHQPKEVRRGSKISPFMVRTFGRRLKHVYGWEEGIFVAR